MCRHLFLFFSMIVFAFSAFGQSQKMLEKISPGLQQNLGKSLPIDSMDLVVAIKESAATGRIQKARILKKYSNQALLFRIRYNDLDSFLMNDQVVFADLLRKPVEELTTGAFDFTANKVNMAHHLYPVFNGNSIRVSVKEQRFDTTDIDFKGRWFNSGFVTPSTNSHASIMATILGGGGNTSLYAKGVAWGAGLTSSDFSSLIPDTDSVYMQYGITVQNHSYGTGIENYYGADASAYDQTVNNIPSLVHVFSAGNSGMATSTTGHYANVPGFANLTGSFKMAKNIITVGAIDSFFNRESSSSSGPAYDGRVKPELVAFGHDGSSGAAALVSGTAAILQHQYKSMFNRIPNSSLVKAVLLNSADDLGNPQVDFKNGYGSLNAYRSMNTIAGGYFFEDSLIHLETKNFQLVLPPGIKQLKLTLAWSDKPAVANAPKALMNDLDLVLRSNTTSDTWLPWVLNHYPHPDSLALPAVRKRDSLNNVEQVTLDMPPAGTYTIEVKGSFVNGKQSFALAYLFDTTAYFDWTWPTGSDPVLGNRKNVLRWESSYQGSGVIEYAVNGGLWQPVASVPDLSKGYQSWNTPELNNKVQLRMTINSGMVEKISDQFTITNPLEMHAGFDCPDSFLLYWNSLPVDSFKLYELGSKYMEPFAVTIDSLIALSKTQHPAFHYSVAPLINGMTGFRSNTIDYRQQGVGCYFQNFFAELLNNQGVLTLNIGTTHNIVEVQFQKLTPAGYIPIATISSFGTNIIHYDPQLSRGQNTYRVQLKLSNGQLVFSEPQTIYYFPDDPVIVYPNPARQNEPVKIITKELDIYSIKVYDAMGRLVHEQLLDDVILYIQPFRLSLGLYFVNIIDDKGNHFLRKLVIN